MTATGNPLSKEEISALAARMFLDVDAVHFANDKPFIFTSGWASPVYMDCRKLISFPDVRREMVDLAISTIQRDIGLQTFDTIAGGETAGIPFAAWIADQLNLPMQYVRKKPRGFGRKAQIEGYLLEGQKVLLIDDLATDGRTKINFCTALRDAGGKVEHVFVLFYYDIFPQSEKFLDDIGVQLHALATWADILTIANDNTKYDNEVLAEVNDFLSDPIGWSRAQGGVAEERMLSQPYGGKPGIS
jgi:orotate phosphoribosyltransferase